MISCDSLCPLPYGQLLLFVHRAAPVRGHMASRCKQQNWTVQPVYPGMGELDGALGRVRGFSPQGCPLWSCWSSHSTPVGLVSGLPWKSSARHVSHAALGKAPASPGLCCCICQVKGMCWIGPGPKPTLRPSEGSLCPGIWVFMDARLGTLGWALKRAWGLSEVIPEPLRGCLAVQTFQESEGARLPKKMRWSGPLPWDMG